MYILGISAYYHDSAAALIKDGEIIAAAQEERFSRKKHDNSFPLHATKYCLKEGSIQLEDVDQIIFYDKPFLKFERLLETYYHFAPQGLFSFLKAMPVWLKEKLFLRKVLQKELKKIGNFKKDNMYFSEHHLSHGASAFYPSPFEEAAILTMDGVGEWATTAISLGRGSNIEVKKELHFPHSLGLVYSAFTQFLGFRVNDGEYKLMGLAPYGDSSSSDTQKYIEKIKTELLEIKEDGSISLNLYYFDFLIGSRMVHQKKWQQLFGFANRTTENPITQNHCNLAYAIQNVIEDIVLKLAKTAKKLSGSENLCLAGGVALNCVANGKLQRSGLFQNIWIQPAAGDAGGALGAAYAGHHILNQKPRLTNKSTDKMKASLLGPSFSNTEIENILKKLGATFQHYQDFDEICLETTKHLINEKVIGWFQGRMEWGPRALGNRSILGDARNPSMQKIINLKIKYRESFRPFAPSVLLEDKDEYFKQSPISPYMLFVAEVADNIRTDLPENYSSLTLKDKLQVQRSQLPSVTHVDTTARVQTVNPSDNPKYWNLLQCFKQKTGVGVLINTSFNVKDEPIVCNPEDAYRCFMDTEMDILVLGDFILQKHRQPKSSIS